MRLCVHMFGTLGNRHLIGQRKRATALPWPIIMPPGRKRTFNSHERRQQKTFQHARSQCSCLSWTQSFGDRLWATHLLHQGYIPQSREAHRQHTAAPVQEASEAPPKELLAAILMLMARSEATSTTIDVERPNLRSCLLRSSCCWPGLRLLPPPLTPRGYVAQDSRGFAISS